MYLLHSSIGARHAAAQRMCGGGLTGCPLSWTPPSLECMHLLCTTHLWSAPAKLLINPPHDLLAHCTLLQVECMTDSSDSQGLGVGIVGAIDYNHYDVVMRPRYSPSYVLFYCSEKPPPAGPVASIGRLGSSTKW
jgi:hypothetical protein